MASEFKLFGSDHLGALALILVLGLAANVAVRRGSLTCRRWIRWIVAGALAASHFAEQSVAWWQGWYQLDMLPLHLCDIAAMLAVYALLTLDRRAAEPLYFFAMAGTLPGIVTPEVDGGFPQFTFVVYFLEHGLTILSASLLVLGLRIPTRPGAWLRAFGQINVLALGMGLVNAWLGTNFLYLSHKPAGSTPFDWFGPWPGYILVLEVVVFVIFRLLDFALPARSNLAGTARPVPDAPRSARRPHADKAHNEFSSLRGHPWGSRTAPPAS